MVDRDDAPRREALRVLYLSWRDRDHPEAGGSETFVERTAAVLADRGHEVTILSAAFPGGSASARHGAVRVLRRGGRFTVYPQGLRHLRRHRHDYDVVVDVQNGIPFWSPLASRVPVVNVVHHAHRDQWPVIMGRTLGAVGWFLESRVAPRVYRRCRYVTVSRATREDLVAMGVDADRVTVTYSGNDLPADYERYDDVPRSPEPSLMVLGRMVPHKHVEVAIDTLRALRDRFPALTLHVVGTGYWLDTLRQHAAAAGVADRVVFHGFVDERTKNELLARSWVVLMPSVKEGWGLTIVEAGLHGTPAVAFRYAGGVTESIIDDETGLLARDAEEMTAHVAALLEDGRLRGKYGENARRHARGFSWEATGAGLEAVLLEVVRDHRADGSGR